MLVRLSVEQQRFSWLIFMICMLEVVLWAAPSVSALAAQSSSFTTDDLYRNHILKDKDHYKLANAIVAPTSGSSDQEAAIERMLARETEALTSGKEGLQPDSKWNIITWTLMTAVTLALGLTNGQKVAPPKTSSGDSKTNDDPESAASKALVVPEKVTPAVKEVVEVQTLSQLEMTDEEVVQAIEDGRVAPHELEDRLDDTSRAVALRRKHLVAGVSHSFDINSIPFENYDYDNVKGKCCENVIGYVPIPVGVVGPVKMNGKMCKVPMATTEGCLVASTHRGMKAISISGGANAVVTDNGMTRGPLVRMPNVNRALEVKAFVESPQGSTKVQAAFNGTSNYARLRSAKVALAGRNVYIRFKAFTGDAMGMNMISKGVEKVLALLKQEFEDLEVVAISGNYCTDKKPAAINWIEGRGRSVTADVTIKGDIVKSVLKTSVLALVDVNLNKNLVGSAMAGSIGGFNAHAANIVTAIYLATGQDPAQNVESSNCITLMEAINNGEDLYMSVTMPSIEIGTVGGGTGLPAQSACLEMMQVRGSSKEAGPGANGDHFAQLIATSVLAGELSLLSAIAAGHLVNSHMQLNRGKGPAAAHGKAPIAPSAASSSDASAACSAPEPGTCLAKL